MSKHLAITLALSLLATAAPLVCADRAVEPGPKQSFEGTSTQRLPFAPGGTIRLNDSYGYLAVEGWDEPEVEITVIKSTDRFYWPSQKEQEQQRFERIRVVAERRSDKELVISTVPPPPKRALLVPRPLLPSARHGVTVDYRIHVPRNSRLEVHHDYGYVWVSDVTGDLDVRSHTGDMTVLLPDPGPYTIDAKTGLGSVSSDFVGNGRFYLAANHFSYSGPAPSRRIYLRMGRGSIAIKNGPASGPVPED